MYVGYSHICVIIGSSTFANLRRHASALMAAASANDRIATEHAKCETCQTWSRQIHKGELMPWCCYRCYLTNGKSHSMPCESWLKRRCRPRICDGRSRSPMQRHHASHSGLSTCARKNCERLVVSIGRYGWCGKHLLRSNPRLHNPEMCIDVTGMLSDIAMKGGPDGRHPEMQRRLKHHPNFKAACVRVIAKLLTQPVVVVMCNHGTHRSVGCLEIAVQEAQKLEIAADFDITTIHIDLDDVNNADWQRLCQIGR